MARFASGRSGFVEEHQAAVYLFLERMARRARDAFMASLKRETGLFVVKKRRLPDPGVVAARAVARALSELVGMRILVAIAAMDGGFREAGVLQGHS